MHAPNSNINKHPVKKKKTFSLIALHASDVNLPI
jgi:hypothetical protein